MNEGNLNVAELKKYWIAEAEFTNNQMNIIKEIFQWVKSQLP